VQSNQQGRGMRVGGQMMEKISGTDGIDVNQIWSKSPFEPDYLLPHPYQFIDTGHRHRKRKPVNGNTSVLIVLRSIRSVLRRYDDELVAALLQGREEFGS
jgi:hypothetical protein